MFENILVIAPEGYDITADQFAVIDRYKHNISKPLEIARYTKPYSYNQLYDLSNKAAIAHSVIIVDAPMLLVSDLAFREAQADAAAVYLLIENVNGWKLCSTLDDLTGRC